MKTLGVILARGGSKGIKRKNIRDLNGHPLIAYSIYAGLKSKYITDLVVSTDDEEIAKISIEYGAKTPFLRPSELAEDHVFSRDALNHAVIETENIFNKKYDYVVELPAVAPLRDSEDIDLALEKLIRTNADSVISVVMVQDKHPVRMKRIKNKKLKDFTTEFPEGESSRRQDLEACYLRNGAIYSMKRTTIIDNYSRVGNDSRPFIMPSEKSVNIDEIIDFYLAEVLIKKGFSNNWPRKISPNFKIKKVQNIKKNKVLISAPYSFLQNQMKVLEKNFDVTYCYQAPLEKLKKLLKNIDIWITSTCPPYKIDKNIIDHAPKLKLLGTPSTGTNHIDCDYIKSKNITLKSIKNSSVINEIYASSEHTFGLILTLVKNIPFACDSIQLLSWRSNESRLRTIEIYGKTIGIIGYGRIGKNIAKYSRCFGMKVIIYDPYKKVNEKKFKQVNNIKELLSLSDIVTIHAHLNEETKNMFNIDCFNNMKNGSFFINTSRGDS